MNQLNRSVPTKQEQLQNLWTHKFIYCNHEKYLQWIEVENIEMIEEYDKCQEVVELTKKVETFLGKDLVN